MSILKACGPKTYKGICGRRFYLGNIMSVYDAFFHKMDQKIAKATNFEQMLGCLFDEVSETV